jgi:glycosyltransferase involved in cell wall biosynthesis
MSVAVQSAVRAQRIAFALPGLHRTARGAEAAFVNVATKLQRDHARRVTLIGGGSEDDKQDYHFLHADLIGRERFAKWPKLPVLRNRHRYEELSFVPGLWRNFSATDYDLTVTCSYPFVNWLLRAGSRSTGTPHVFVTQNGDWPAQRRNSEYRWFSCDGLVCTNPEFYERHKNDWHCALIPNGVDVERFFPATRQLQPQTYSGRPRILIVSALAACKRVDEGLRAAAKVPDCEVLVAGGGPLAEEIDSLGRELLGDRYSRRQVLATEMPGIYRDADVFLHMSTGESFGNVYVEAAATGLPVVAHGGTVTQWILGDDGYLVDTQDDEAVTQALRSALEDRCGDAAVARSRACAGRFSWEVVAARYAEFFDEVYRRNA